MSRELEQENSGLSTVNTNTSLIPGLGRRLENHVIQCTPVDSIKPNPRNPRHHDVRQIRQIAKSVATFDFVVPILVDSQRNIIAGHGRWLAAKQLGLNVVPIIQIDHLTDAQIKALMIADNRLTENSRWDDNLLRGLLLDLSSCELDFSIDVTGFEVGEIDLRIESHDQPSESDPADDFKASTGAVVSRLGTMWILGKNRVHCSDAREATTYESLMAGKQAAAVITDPPFNVRVNGHVSGLGTVQHQEFAMASGEMTKAEFIAFLSTVMRHLKRHSKNGSLHYLFIDWRHVEEMINAGNQVYEEFKNIIAWCKTTGGMGSLYRSAHELICLFKNGNVPHRNNVQLGRHGRNRTNVWTYAGANQTGTGEEGKLLHDHPTPKPVRLIADAILDCTARNEIVLDSFLGIGSTLIAAQRVGRQCYGIEIEPKYVDCAVRRWQAFTGDAAIDAATGLTFNEIAARGGDNGK